MYSNILNKQCYFDKKCNLKNEVVALANEATLSIENKNQLYVRIKMRIIAIENILIENIEFF